MDELRERALTLLKHENKIERVIRRYRTICAICSISAFIAGFFFGNFMPFHLELVAHGPHIIVQPPPPGTIPQGFTRVEPGQAKP